MANFDPAWLGYAALVSLLAAGFVARVEQVRLGIAVAALLALPAAIFGWRSLGATALLAAIFVFHPVLSARGRYRDAGIRFTPAELAQRTTHQLGLRSRMARRPVDHG